MILRLLQKHGVEYNILTTVNAQNGDYGREVYRFLRDGCGARYLQFIPIIERFTGEAHEWSSWQDRPLYVQEGANVTHRSVTPQQFGAFNIGMFDEWVRRDVGTVFVQLFDVTLENFYGEPGSLCVHRATCGGSLAMEHNGDVYSCDHFVEPKHKLGNIAQTPLIVTVGHLVARKRHADVLEALAALLPRVRRALRVPWRLPQGPLSEDARRRGGPELPVRGLQGVLPPRRRADARHVRPAARGPRAGGDRAAVSERPRSVTAPLARAGVLVPFARFLDEAGVPSWKVLEAARLPPEPQTRPANSARRCARPRRCGARCVP